MAVQLRAVTFDCGDPPGLAGFWADVTGREVMSSNADMVRLAADVPGGPRILFIRVPEGKTVKNRLHIDLTAQDRATEVARVVALGATVTDEIADHGHQWTVLRDPEGNEFCIVQDPEATG